VSLAERQAQLVRALVAGGPSPQGFSEERLEIQREALLRKRSEEVCRAWPNLAASYGDEWTPVFAAWAAGRPPLGSALEGWDFACDHPPEPGPAAVELMVFEVGRRKAPAFSYRHGVLAVHVAGRVRVFGKVP
jgi:hypothetical protein